MHPLQSPPKQIAAQYQIESLPPIEDKQLNVHVSRRIAGA